MLLLRALRNRASLLKNRLLGLEPDGFPKDGWIDIDHQGFTWHLCLTHYLDRSIARGHIWEPDGIGIINKFIKPGMCVLDVGANFGYYTLPMSRLVGTTGIVNSFEPTNTFYERLTGNISSNALENVRTHPVGLSDRAEELEIGVGDCSATLHWCADTPPPLTERIKLVRLDDWWNEYTEAGNPDRLEFMKVDLDGHEPRFLRGAENTLRRHHPHLLIEFCQMSLFTSGFSAWELADQLEAMDYTLCSEKDGKPFRSRRQLLVEAGNFSAGANVLARPAPAAAAERSSSDVTGE